MAGRETAPTALASETLVVSVAARILAGGNDGDAPQAPVVGFKGALYGTTYKGGGTGCSGNGCGALFSVTP